MSMHSRLKSIGAVTLALGVWVAAAGSAEVLIVSGGDAGLDTAMQDALVTQGHTVTVGPRYYELLPGDIGDPEVILLVIRSNWSAADMPLETQMAIEAYVRDGGGLVTGEWVNWKSSGSQLQIIG